MNALSRLLSPTVPEPLSPGRPPHAMERAEERIDYPADADYPTTEEDDAAVLDDTYEEPVEEMAVRVYPVAAPPRDRVTVTWEAGTLDVDVRGSHRMVQIAAAHRGRKRLVVRNMSLASNVILVPSKETLPFLGLKLNATQEIEMLHTEAVWAYAEDDGDPATVTFIAEYERPEEDTVNG